VDEKAVRRTLEQAFRLWFKPELDKRAAAGTIKPGFKVWGVQVVLDLEAEQPKVRINEEIRGAFIGRTRRTPKVSDVLVLRDIENIKSMQLTEEDPNAGHLTAVVHKGRWNLLRFPVQRNSNR